MAAAAPFIAPEGEKTFQFDDSLPPLPVPPLPQTLEKYLDSVKPHVTEPEFQHTVQLVEQFAKGVGKVLHEKLVERSKTERNWLEKWWEDHAYLEGRFPIAPYVNCAGPGPYIDHYYPPQEGTQVERGALLLHIQLKYWQLIRKEQLRPDRGSDNSVWAMNTFHRLFSSCRLPGEHMDHLVSYFKTEREGTAPRHLLFIHRGHMFYTDLIDENDEPYSAPEIEDQLQMIIDMSRKLPEGQGLGSLTGGERTSWYKDREHLIALHPDNAKNLEILQSSACVVGLDDVDPIDRTGIFTHSLGGDAAQRWFDKSLNVIINRNGTIGMNIDHCPFDAMVLVSCCYYMDRMVVETKGKWQGSLEKRQLPRPKHLIFHLDDHLRESIKAARALHRRNVESIEGYGPCFKGFGKKFMRSRKLHPDTLVQLALQHAYYKLHNKPAPTYETATTRRFYHGRTETVRSCTMEAIDWCKAMLDPRVSSQRKFQLFMVAYKKHLKLMSEASNAQGCDRHLYGLYLAAQKEGIPVPEIFTDPSFVKSGGGGNFTLSTSFVGYTTVIGGVAPMCKDGYGCFYQIRPNMIYFYISTWVADETTSARTMFDTITDSLKGIQQLVEENSTSKM